MQLRNICWNYNSVWEDENISSGYRMDDAQNIVDAKTDVKDEIAEQQEVTTEDECSGWV